MAPESVRIYTNFFSLILESSMTVLGQQVGALHHRLNYRASPDALNIVVIGGSFSGLQLARRLSNSLPSGYRVVLVEKNSHFNFTFNFPRYSVVGEGRERKAFVPYTYAFKRSPVGSWGLVRDKVTGIADGEVLLQSGEKLTFKYLVIATGVIQPHPARMISDEREEACEELRRLRARIQEAQRIAIVGGGAVGVQLSADIKSAFPTKEIVLVHSKERLLNSFGERLSGFVLGKLEDLGVRVMLGQRPVVPPVKVDGLTINYAGGQGKDGRLSFTDGRTEEFDLIVPCTGAVPNSGLLSSFLPNSIAPETHHIMVRSTLQLLDNAHQNIFALGDVAETGGPKMARAGMMQADIVSANIVASIKGVRLQEYVPSAIEGFLKLSLGLKENVIYVKDGKGGDIMVPGKSKNIDLEAYGAWWYLGANMKTEGV